LERSAKINANERVFPEDHLIGIYLVENIRYKEMLREICNTGLTTLKESKVLLEREFTKSNIDNEVIC
jgi:hypothetical protein